MKLLRPDVDEGVSERERRGHKGCLCFKPRSDLRNVPLGHSRELPAANNALNVSYGWRAPTLLALLQGPDSSKMMDTGNPTPQEPFYRKNGDSVGLSQKISKHLRRC